MLEQIFPHLKHAITHRAGEELLVWREWRYKRWIICCCRWLNRLNCGQFWTKWGRWLFKYGAVCQGLFLSFSNCCHCVFNGTGRLEGLWGDAVCSGVRRRDCAGVCGVLMEYARFFPLLEWCSSSRHLPQCLVGSWLHPKTMAVQTWNQDPLPSILPCAFEGDLRNLAVPQGEISVDCYS